MVAADCGPVLDVEKGDIITIDTSCSTRPGVPAESELEILETVTAEKGERLVAVRNLSPENLLPLAFLGGVYRGRRSENGPWLDVFSMDYGFFPYDFEIKRIKRLKTS